MITLEQFWMGRDKIYAHKLGSDIRSNAIRTVSQVNHFLFLAVSDGGVEIVRLPNGSLVTSGWRPSEINSKVPNAGKRSHHIFGRACDVHDPKGLIDKWAASKVGIRALEKCGLWLEHPDDTPRWSHYQTLPPPSGRRIFRSK